MAAALAPVMLAGCHLLATPEPEAGADATTPGAEVAAGRGDEATPDSVESGATSSEPLDDDGPEAAALDGDGDGGAGDVQKPPAGEDPWAEKLNLASFEQGASVVSFSTEPSSSDGPWHMLNDRDTAGSKWSNNARDDDGKTGKTEAVVELAAVALVDGVGLAIEETAFGMGPTAKEIVVELGDAASGPWTELARWSPSAIPDQHRTALVAPRRGRYVRVTLVGPREADAHFGPYLNDLEIYGSFVEAPAKIEGLVGMWHGGWLLGGLKIVERSGRLVGCLDRSGNREVAIDVEGRSVRLRWKGEDGGHSLALLSPGPDGALLGDYQSWDADGNPAGPALLTVERSELAPDFYAACNDPKAFEDEDALDKELEKDGRARIYGIHFDFAKDTLRPDADPVIGDVVKVLERHGEWSLTIEGHTDAVGSDAANQRLSERRAAAVVEALVKRGIARDRLDSAGFGASRPVAPNDTPQGRAQNRRVELVRR